MIARDARMTHRSRMDRFARPPRAITGQARRCRAGAGRHVLLPLLARGARSPIGRTRTPRPTPRVRLAIVSCSNFPFGFFNVYARIAARADLNAVLHLGDYIYEYANGHYGNRNEGDGRPLDRVPFPDREIVTSTTIARYAQYREDPDLQAAHRQHPFIAVWDDHGVRTACPRWRGKSSTRRGPWPERKATAIRAWRSGCPCARCSIPDYHLYREFAFGDLADLMMLDTRLEGRDGRRRRATTWRWNGPRVRSLPGAGRMAVREPARSNRRRKAVADAGAAGDVLAANAPGAATPNADSWDDMGGTNAGAPGGGRRRIEASRRVHGRRAVRGYDIAANPFDSGKCDPGTGRDR